MLSLKNVSKFYATTQNYALKNISLTIIDGEILVLLGASGSGKSTLLALLNGLIQPSSGSIYLNQQDIIQLDPIDWRRSMGFVFQHNCLMPHWTVEENVATVLRLRGISRAKRLKRAHELLSFVQLEPSIYAQRFPDQLSGGQQQRVNIARALANDPQYILMDEPFTALDPSIRVSLQEEVLRLKKELNKTIVFVTHDMNEAFYLADRVVFLCEGAIAKIGNVDEMKQYYLKRLEEGK